MSIAAKAETPLTHSSHRGKMSSMRLTIDLPDELAERLEPQRARLAEIIERGLRAAASESCTLARELIDFLAHGPAPAEIVAFHPSNDSVDRARQLLEKNRAGLLTGEEQAELDEMARLNQLFALIKIQARQHLRASG